MDLSSNREAARVGSWQIGSLFLARIVVLRFGGVASYI